MNKKVSVKGQGTGGQLFHGVYPLVGTKIILLFTYLLLFIFIIYELNIYIY